MNDDDILSIPWGGACPIPTDYLEPDLKTPPTVSMPQAGGQEASTTASVTRLHRHQTPSGTQASHMVYGVLIDAASRG